MKKLGCWVSLGFTFLSGHPDFIAFGKHKAFNGTFFKNICIYSCRVDFITWEKNFEVQPNNFFVSYYLNIPFSTFLVFIKILCITFKADVQKLVPDTFHV